MNWTARVGICALTLLAACASTTRRPVVSREARILDLPVVTQDRMYDCGLVSISSLCKYWNTDIPEDVQQRLSARAAEKEGLSGTELCQALNDLGFETFLFRGSLDDETTGLRAQIEAHRPAVIMLASPSGSQHYVLFVGFDDLERNVCLLDPVRGRVLVPYETFDVSWGACDHFTLVAVPLRSEPLVTLQKEPS